MKLCFQSQNICYNIINFFSGDHYLVSYTIASLATKKLNSKEKYFNEKNKVARYLEQKMDVQGPTIKKILLTYMSLPRETKTKNAKLLSSCIRNVQNQWNRIHWKQNAVNSLRTPRPPRCSTRIMGDDVSLRSCSSFQGRIMEWNFKKAANSSIAVC